MMLLTLSIADNTRITLTLQEIEDLLVNMTLPLYDMCVPNLERPFMQDLSIPMFLGVPLTLNMIESLVAQRPSFLRNIMLVGRAYRGASLLTAFPNIPSEVLGILQDLEGLVSISYATKLVHRYFPALVPIIDEDCVWPAYANAVRASHDWTVSDVLSIMNKLRESVAVQESNLKALREAIELKHRWTNCLSTLRFYDLVLWRWFTMMRQKQ